MVAKETKFSHWLKMEKKCCEGPNAFVFDRILIILAFNQDNHKKTRRVVELLAFVSLVAIATSVFIESL